MPLSGTGVAPGPILNANPASLSFAGTVVGTSSATQTVTVTNSGTTVGDRLRRRGDRRLQPDQQLRQLAVGALLHGDRHVHADRVRVPGPAR